jgi:ribosomal protein L35AE/L33A
VTFFSTNCAKKRFKILSYRLFGHTHHRHQILHKEAEKSDYSFEISSKVKFNYKDKELQGVIKRITKRATVVVIDRLKRERIYYVPLEYLTEMGGENEV